MANKPPRIDSIEYNRRIFIIQGWIVDGIQPALIIRQILTQQWAQSKRHADRMLAAARDEWVKVPIADIEQRRQIKVLELQQYIRNMDERYKKTPTGIQAIAAIQKLIITLDGLNPPKKVEVSGRDGKPIETATSYDLSKFTDEELRFIIELQRKGGTGQTVND